MENEIKEITEKVVKEALGNLEAKVLSDPRLRDAMTHYREAYLESINVVMGELQKQVKEFSLKDEARSQYILRGIELTSDLALKIAITIEANKDNLLLKALDSTAQMIGMMAQGGLEVPENQFSLYYQALSAIFDRAGIKIELKPLPPKPEEPDPSPITRDYAQQQDKRDRTALPEKPLPIEIRNELVEAIEKHSRGEICPKEFFRIAGKLKGYKESEDDLRAFVKAHQENPRRIQRLRYLVKNGNYK